VRTQQPLLWQMRAPLLPTRIRAAQSRCCTGHQGVAAAAEHQGLLQPADADKTPPMPMSHRSGRRRRSVHQAASL